MDLEEIKCFVFDFGGTLSSHPYFYVCPPNCPDWFELFQKHVFSEDSPTFDQWMEGKVSAEDVAAMMAPVTRLPCHEVLEYMKKGLRNLSQNDAVRSLAIAAREMGKRTALVTGNIDLFDSVVVPDLDLESLFDVIVNSSRSGELRKLHLWDEAFKILGGGITYETSLLIEDSSKNVNMFRDQGGFGHHYLDDQKLNSYLKKVGVLSNAVEPQGKKRKPFTSRQGKHIDCLHVEIKTSRLKLRPTSPEFAQDMFKEFTDEVTRYMGPSPSKSIDETLKFIEDSLECMKQGNNLQFWFFTLKSGSIIM